MNQPRRVLIATQNPTTAGSMITWLGEAGFELTIVTTFEAAKAQLAMRPALVIADVKLGAYNGLQVAARARLLGIASIVIGPPDVVLVRDANDLGAAYLESEVAESPLVAMTRRLVADHEPDGDTQDGAAASQVPAFADAAEDHWPLWHDEGAIVRPAGGKPVVH